MASGIEVSPDVAEVYNAVKLRKTHKYVIFYIKEKKLIVTKELGPEVGRATETKEEDKQYFDGLKAELLSSREPRYVIYDFGFAIGDGRKISKMAFIFYCPDNSVVSQRMIYASSKDSVKKVLVGLGIEFQANDDGDLDYDTLAAEVERKA